MLVVVRISEEGGIGEHDRREALVPDTEVVGEAHFGHDEGESGHRVSGENFYDANSPEKLPANIRLNEDVIPAVATQCAGLAVDKATQAANDNKVHEAVLILKQALEKILSFGNKEKAADGIHALESLLQTLEIHGDLDARSSKASKFRSSHMRKMKSMASWTLDEQAPSYSKKNLPPDSAAGEKKES